MSCPVGDVLSAVPFTVFRRISRLGTVAALGLVLTACSGPRATTPVVPSSILDSQETIAAACDDRTVHRRGTAGFELLEKGDDAYLARLAAVEAAQHTLDFQYFIWQDDVIGTTFAERLLAAADRGVKVRMLLDITHKAQREVKTTILAAHPNIEIAFFNPMSKMKGIFAGNPLPIIGELDRMQSRMHNKMVIADRSVVIGGGRNLADTYFGADRKRNMRDIDFIAVGPVVKDASRSFELYWQSPLTHKGDRSKLTKDDHEDLRDLRKKVNRKKRTLAWRREFKLPLLMSRTKAVETLRTYVGRMIWAEYEFVADPPERMLQQGRIASPVWHSVEGAIADARKEVVMHAAYLIPQDGTLKLFQEVSGRGVKLNFLTNSLASIDGIMAMAGIANRRRDVLNAGVTLSELDAHAPSRKGYILAPKLTPMGMHSKGMVVDDRISFVGSYNMDPRSKYINTETGVIIRSPAFAHRFRQYLDLDLRPENCWRISSDAKGRITWSRQMPGRKPEIHHHDPDTPWQRRIAYWLLTHMPWEDLL